MFSTDASLPSPQRRFPFDASGGASPQPLPDCHLSRTAIPDPPISDSLGVFHSGPFRFLSSFASSLSREYRPARQGHGARTLSFPVPELLTQGRLRCTQRSRRKSRVAPQCRFNPVPYRGRLPQREYAPAQYPVSTAAGSVLPMPLGLARPPQAKMPPPSIHPRLGVRSRHHGFHRYALQRIFRPFPDTGGAD